MFLDSLTWFVILSLATWRFTSLISSESGPYAILERMRHKLGVRQDSQGEYGETEIAKGILCKWCSSVWWGIGFSALAVIAGLCPPMLSTPYALGLSASAILIQELLEGKNND